MCAVKFCHYLCIYWFLKVWLLVVQCTRTATISRVNLPSGRSCRRQLQQQGRGESSGNWNGIAAVWMQRIFTSGLSSAWNKPFLLSSMTHLETTGGKSPTVSLARPSNTMTISNRCRSCYEAREDRGISVIHTRIGLMNCGNRQKKIWGSD